MQDPQSGKPDDPVLEELAAVEAPEELRPLVAVDVPADAASDDEEAPPLAVAMELLLLRVDAALEVLVELAVLVELEALATVPALVTVAGPDDVVWPVPLPEQPASRTPTARIWMVFMFPPASVVGATGRTRVAGARHAVDRKVVSPSASA